jgi:hypothetical protein
LAEITAIREALDEHHLKMLRDESKISERVIAARGYYTEHDPEELGRLGFDENQQVLVPALVIPIRDVTGEMVLHRIRPDDPRPNPYKPGKVNKYEMPTGRQNVLDIPPFTFEHLQNINYSLWVTEGESKADSLISQGVAAIALFGVWSWKRAGLPLPDFDRIPMIGRDVNVVFDSDTEDNVNIRQALMYLAHYLKGRTGGA